MDCKILCEVQEKLCSVPSGPFVSLIRVLSKSIADPILSFSQSNLGFPGTVKKVVPSSLKVAYCLKNSI